MDDQSAQPCGCDLGAGYVCRRHQEEASFMSRNTVPATGPFVKAVYDGMARLPDWDDLSKYLDGCGAETAPTRATTLPQDPKERKKYPIATGVLFYFPDAIAAVARVSFEGNEQHNPGEKLHWARGKSMDQEDTLVRHLMESGTFDTDGQRHSAKAAWRALAMLQLEIERDRQ